MDLRKVNRVWQSATLLIAPVLLVVLVWLKPDMEPYQWLLWLHLPLLMLHEAEEYVLPGLITNSFLLLPYATWTLIHATGFFTWSDWLLSAVLGVGVVGVLGAKTRGRLARLRRQESPANP